MRDATHSTLVFRFRPSNEQTPDIYPVEATLDGVSTLTAAVEILPEELKAIESRPWEYGRRLGKALFSDENLRRALAYARGPKTGRVAVGKILDDLDKYRAPLA